MKTSTMGNHAGLVNKAGLTPALLFFVFTVTSVFGANIVPQPRDIVWKKEAFRLGNDVTIVSENETMTAAEDFQRELSNVCRIKCAIASPKESSRKRTITLQTGGLSSGESGSKEGYTLLVDKDGIVIRSSDAAGVFYGVQTLKQLLERQGDDIVALGCEIHDEPAMGMRGILFYIGETPASPEAVEALKRVIDTYAQLKLNTLYVWFGSNIRLDRQPLSPKGFSKSQMADLVAYAKARYFEVIPYFQMFTHGPWILANPKNVALLEDPNNKGWQAGWCPSNPAVYSFINDILDEALEIFQPRYCHVGLDELNFCAFGVCEKCRKEKPSQLYLTMITNLHDRLAARGVKTILWGDSMLPESEQVVHKVRGAEIVDQVPRDIIVALYGTTFEKMISYYSQKGFSVLGHSTWSPVALQAVSAGTAAFTKTSGVGYIGALWYQVKDWAQIQKVSAVAWRAIALTAQFTWNPTNPTLEEIRYDPIQKIRQMYGPKRSLSEGGAWESIPLDTAFNDRIGDDETSWPGYGRNHSLRSVFSERIVCDDVTFQLKDSEVKNIILLSGSSNDGMPRESISIPIERKAKRLAFLHACNIPSDRDELSIWQNAIATPSVGQYRINYADGSSKDMPLLYRWNIMDWNGRMGGFEGQIAYAGKTKEGARIQLLRSDWDNPTPEKVIRSVSMSTSQRSGMSLALFAISSKNLEDGFVDHLLATTQKIRQVNRESILIPATNTDYGSGPSAMKQYFPGGVNGVGLFLGQPNAMTRNDRVLVRFNLSHSVLSVASVKYAELFFEVQYYKGSSHEIGIDHLSETDEELSVAELLETRVNVAGTVSGDANQYSIDVTKQIIDDIKKGKSYSTFRFRDISAETKNKATAGSSFGVCLKPHFQLRLK